MASSRASILSEGALYETIARGNKDNYFLSKSLKDAVNPFETRYLRRPGHVSELRRTIPLNAPDFGRTCEFEFEIAGDIFLDSTLLIDLPCWLPPLEAALSAKSNYQIATPSPTNRMYGYSRGIGHFLFSSIQLFQDKILLQEFSGDAIWASKLSRGSLNSSYLDHALTGMSDTSDNTLLYRNANPGRLRLPLPMLGGLRGVPSIAMRHQTFRLKVVLRSLEECIECSDDSVVLPAPWKEQAFIVTPPAGAGAPYSVAPLPRESIGRPTLTLETRHIYLDPDSRDAIQKIDHEIPYSIFYENPFTFGGLDYITSTSAATPTFTRIIDASHTASRLFWFLRTKDDLMRGRRWATSNANNTYYTQSALLIAGRDRESLQTPLIWNTLVPFSKEHRDPGFSLGEMNWDLGKSIIPMEAVPEGSINFSTAEKPVFQIYLQQPAPPQTFITLVVEMILVVESWCLYTIEDQRGFLRYSN
jgi:hypothetical protein